MSRVVFGNIASTSFSVESGTQLTVVSPPTTQPGTVDISVFDGSGTGSPINSPDDQFTYLDDQIYVSPSSATTDQGQSVPLTAVVTADPPGSPIPTGTVRFKAIEQTGTAPQPTFDLDPGGNPVSLSNGSASISVTSLPESQFTYQISASYSGDSNYPPQTGTSVLSVNGPPPPNVPGTTIAISPTSSQASVGGNAEFAATVLQNGSPISKMNVSFSVTGKNSTSGIVPTDASGVSVFSYPDTGGVGTDTVTASITTNSGPMSASANQSWVDTTTISITPATFTGDVGKSVTLSAIAIDGAGKRLTGLPVTFTVVSGPNVGKGGTFTTDSNGVANYTYSSGITGTDSVQASGTDKSGTLVTSSPVQVRWISSSITISPARDSGQTGETASFTATAKVDGVPQAGAQILFTISGGPNSGAVFGPFTSNSQGQATLSYTSGTGGDDFIYARFVDPAGQLIQTVAGAQETWLIVNLKLTPASSTLQTGNSVTLTANVTLNGGPIIGVNVSFVVVSGPTAGATGSVTTDVSGNATWMYSGSNGGTDTIGATYTNAHGIQYSGEATVTWTEPPPPPIVPSGGGGGAGGGVDNGGGSGSDSSGGTPNFPPGGSTFPFPSSTSNPGSGNNPNFTPTPFTPPTTVPPGESFEPPGGGSTSSGGTTSVPKIKTRSEIAAAATLLFQRQGHRGTPESWSKGWGTGAFGGPPGPASIAQSLPSPAEISFRPKLVGQNALITLILVVAIIMAAELFNWTFGRFRDDLSVIGRLSRPAFSKVDRGVRKINGAIALIVFGLGVGALAGMIDPTFRFDLVSLAEMLGLAVAFILCTGIQKLIRGVYMERRFWKSSYLKAFPMAVLIAGALVLISRLSHFEPGYIFGIVGALAFKITPVKANDGKATWIASFWMLLVAGAAWGAWIPLKSIVEHGHTGFGFLVLDTALSAMWVCTVLSLVISLVPMKHLNGESVVRWSKLAWAGLYTVCVFLFVHTIAHPRVNRYGGNLHSNLANMTIPFEVFFAAAFCFWLFWQTASLLANRQRATETFPKALPAVASGPDVGTRLLGPAPVPEATPEPTERVLVGAGAPTGPNPTVGSASTLAGSGTPTGPNPIVGRSSNPIDAESLPTSPNLMDVTRTDLGPIEPGNGSNSHQGTLPI